jgi:hypothetical protein
MLACAALTRPQRRRACSLMTDRPLYASKTDDPGLLFTGHFVHSSSSFGLLLRSLSLLKDRVRLLLRLRLLPPRPPRPPLPPLGFSFGGGRTNAKSTEIVWSSSFVLFSALIAAFASGWVGYSIRAYPCWNNCISPESAKIGAGD